MKKTKSICYSLLLAIAFLFGLEQAQSQVPGYMGHRLSIQANLEFIPTLVGVTTNNNKFFKSRGYGAWGISKRYGAALNYAISRHRALTVTFDYFRTGRIERVFNDIGSSAAEGMYAINCYTLAVGNRYYKNIAPMGAYFEMAGELSFLNTKFKNYTYNRYGNPSTLPTGNRYQFSNYDFGLNLGWGYSNIINNHLVLDFGIKSHFSVPGFYYLFANLSENSDINSQYVRITKGFHSILMFRMSVGYLF